MQFLNNTLKMVHFTFHRSNLFFTMALLVALSLGFQSCDKDDSSVSPTEEEPTSLRVALSGHWDFIGNANDRSKYENHGSVKGAIPVKDRFGMANGAFEFNGKSDYIDLGNITFVSWGGRDAYTISAWVKPDSTGGAIVSKWNGGVLAGWYLDLTNEQMCRSYRNVTPWVTTSVDPVEPGKWHHILTKYDGEDLYIYVDGELQAQQPFSSQPEDFKTNVLIGARHSNYNPSGFFSGVIDEVRLYSRDLDMTEIQWLANH